MNVGGYENVDIGWHPKFLNEKYAASSNVNETREREEASRDSMKGEGQAQNFYFFNNQQASPDNEFSTCCMITLWFFPTKPIR